MDLGYLFGENPGVKKRDDWMKANASRVTQGARVLDIGAGTQKYRHLFSHCRYVAHDFIRDYGTPDIVCEIDELPRALSAVWDGELADVIVCTEVLEHVAEPSDFLGSSLRCLKPGGLLLLTVPCCSCPHGAPLHYTVGFSRGWLDHHLKKHNAEILSVEECGRYFLYMEQELRHISSRFRAKGGLFFILGVAWFVPAYVAAILFRLLDRYDENKERVFTLGYHVIGVRHTVEETAAPEQHVVSTTTGTTGQSS